MSIRFALISVLLSPCAWAQVELGEGNSFVFRDTGPVTKASYILTGSQDNSSNRPMEILNIRGFMVLNEVMYTGGETWRTVVPIGEIDRATGRVRLFGQTTASHDGRTLTFQFPGVSFPQLRPEIASLDLNETNRERFEYALASALIEQTLSDRTVDLQHVAQLFVQQYSRKRSTMDADLRKQFDKRVLSSFAASGFTSLYGPIGMYMEAALDLLKFGHESNLFVELNESQRTHVERLLENLNSTEGLDFLEQGRRERFLQREAETLSAISGSLSAAKAANCGGLGAAFEGNG